MLKLTQKKCVQERLGIQVSSLTEDFTNATIAQLAQEAYAKLTLGGGKKSSIAQIGEESNWISPAPSSVKMRIFCLPYAGGVSEIIFARWAPPGNRMMYQNSIIIYLYMQNAP